MMGTGYSIPHSTILKAWVSTYKFHDLIFYTVWALTDEQITDLPLIVTYFKVSKKLQPNFNFIILLGILKEKLFAWREIVLIFVITISFSDICCTYCFIICSPDVLTCYFYFYINVYLSCTSVLFVTVA